MSEPRFTRANTSDLLFYLDPGSAEVPEHYSIAFLPDRDDPSLGLSITLSVSWKDKPGIYLFLGDTISDPAGFVPVVRSYVRNKKIRFLWIANPRAAANLWLANYIEINQAAGQNQGQVSRTAQVRFRSYLLSMGMGCGIAPDDTSGTVNGFTISKVAGQPGSVIFQTGSGSGTVQTGDTVTIPFSTNNAGCLRFSLSLQKAGNPNDDSGLDKLDACCRYFIDDDRWPGFNYLQSLRYPIVSVPDQGLTLYGNLDPVFPLEPQRSFMNFLETPQSQGKAIPSAFRTVFGEAVTMTPAVSDTFPTGPSLVFSVFPRAQLPNDADPYYMTLRGSFELLVPTSSGNPVGGLYERLMCGISGVEYAGTGTAAGNLIHFFPGQPAYAPVFNRPGTTTDTGTNIDVDAPPLTGLATTAWAYLTAPTGGKVEYFAQPESSIFYQATLEMKREETDSADFLYYLEMFAGTFPRTIQAPPAGSGAATAFPMVPYALADLSTADLDTFRQLEIQLLSPLRRSLLHDILEPTETGTKVGERKGATPQGLLLKLDRDLKYWEQLTLAKNGSETLDLANITGPFKSALQTNQLFAVISNPDTFTQYADVVGDFSLTIEGWGFELSPANWTQHNTIVIFKFAEKSIEEMAGDTGTWTWPDAADGYGGGQGNLATTQADLQQIIARAKANAGPGCQQGDFANFCKKVCDPSWNGILFLRADLSASSFPPELQGLAAGIDQDQFYAHHLGINVTPVHNIDNQLSQEDSSIFGLIYYDDPEDLVYTGTEYDYKVLSLKILFQNSAIANFYSQVELMVHRLFGDLAVLRDSQRGNNIILDGFYQKHGTEASYVFLQQGSIIFDIGGFVLDQVEITRTQFVTLLPRAASADTVMTRFVMTGYLRFKELVEFDMFSFGNVYEADGVTVKEPGRLSFSDLAINMRFSQTAPEDKTMTFDAGTMAFDMSKSLAREKSLFNHFPLKLSGLVQAPEDTAPGDLGYISLSSPLPQGALEYPWYSLNFELDFGTLGALAGDIGFVVTLMAAWAPGGTQLKTYVGIKLPGSNSANSEIPIEGVLKLSFRAIEFTVGTGDEGINYMLRFREIALRLLSLSFPPGQTDLYLFGDPSGAQSRMLGWYAAYAKDEKNNNNKT